MPPDTSSWQTDELDVSSVEAAAFQKVSSLTPEYKVHVKDPMERTFSDGIHT